MNSVSASGPAASADQHIPWHAREVDAALASLEAERTGLAEGEATARRERHGPNILPAGKKEGPLVVLFRQINNPLIWVLIASSVLAVLLGKVVDGAVVLGVVVVNTLIGFVQELRAGTAIEALQQMVPLTATVTRNGAKRSLPAAELVPGDIVHLASGDQVPADLRLLHERSLKIEEATLTGESVPSDKAVDRLTADAELGDRRNMAYSGTLVTYGTGTGVVVATGMATELGRISGMLQETIDLQTPLTRQMGVVARWLTLGILLVAVVLLGIGVARGYSIADAVLAGVTLAVAAIPEGLPAIITIALAIGVRRMARRRAIIRKLPAVETLGSTTVICTDKTGTLTRNEMTVQALWVPGGSSYSVAGIGYEPSGTVSGADGAAPRCSCAGAPAWRCLGQRCRPAPGRRPLDHRRRSDRGRAAGRSRQGRPGTGAFER
ncbi:MAG: cation-translocating P-type ATPase [Planctomycetota bacterium]